MSKNQRKALYIILSFFISALLWLYVSAVEDPEDKTDVRNVQVTYTGEEALASRNLSVIANETPSLRLTFSGRRSDLNKVDNKNVSVLVDLSQITYPGKVQCAYSVVLPDGVKNSLSTVGYSSMYVTLFIDHEDSKTVDVRLVQNVTAAEGYMVESGAVDPYEVKIKGPASILEKVEYAEATLNRTDVDQSVEATLNYVLKDKDGNNIDSLSITLDTQSVHASVPIKKTKSVALDVDIRDGGGITLQDNVSYSISPDSIMISGDPATVDPVNVLKIGQIDLSKIDASCSLDFKIVIPNDCENLSGVSVAKVTLEITNSKKRDVSISNIDTINEALPEGYMIRLITKELTVTLRGAEDIVGLVNPVYVRAVVDLKDQTLQLGQASFPATIYTDGYSKVGAVGNYRVALEIVPIPPEQTE